MTEQEKVWVWLEKYNRLTTELNELSVLRLESCCLRIIPPKAKEIQTIGSLDKIAEILEQDISKKQLTNHPEHCQADIKIGELVVLEIQKWEDEDVNIQNS